MKTRSTFFFASLFALAGSLAQAQDAYPIHLTVRIYQLDPEIAASFESIVREAESSSDLPRPFTANQRFGVVVRAVNQWEQQGKAELIAQPLIAAPSGSWSTFDLVREITYPTEYDPATLPKELPGKVLVGGVPDEKGAVKTNESNGLIPPFPKAFEERHLGLQLKMRPQLEAGGNVAVDFKIDHSALLGFINYGSPIEMEKPGALRKNAKPIELLENQILMPAFEKQVKDFQLSHGEFFLLQAETKPTKAAAAPPPEFANLGKEHTEPGLPSLLFLVSGSKLNPGLKPLSSTDSGTAAAESRSWPLPKVVRRSLALNSDQPGPAAASALKKRLAEIGIVTRDLTIDPEWNLKVSATPEMIARLSELIPVYAANPRIYITSKFLELSKPLEIDKSILSETEFQVLIRDLNQKQGVNLLTAPSMVMRPFQDGKVEVVKDLIYPISYDPPEVESAKGSQNATFHVTVTPSAPRKFNARKTGVQLGIRSWLFEDGSIDLSFRPEVTEFLGFLNFGQPIHVLRKGKLGNFRRVELAENEIEMPVLRSRSLASRVRIPDGAIIIVGGLVTHDVQEYHDKIPVLGDLPLIGWAANSKKMVTVPRYIYVALTATVQEGPAVTKAE